MMKDALESFLAANTVDRLKMAQDPALAGPLQAYFGADALARYQSLAAGADLGGHLAISHPVNLIFVPGVTGSLLQSRTKGGVWWIDARTRAHIEDLRLKADGVTDANPDDALVPFAVDTSYEPFLTAVLGRQDFGHDMFPYDWRKPLSASVPALRRLIDDTYDQNGNQPVHLVAHSMGGLMVRETLRAHDSLWNKVGRVVFIGTPHYGSQAMGGYLKNHFWGFELMALLGIYLSRDAFRSMWGPLSLLPAPRGVYPGTRPQDAHPWPNDGSTYLHPCANFDIHDAHAWKLDLPAEQTAELQAVLDAAATMQRDLDRWHDALLQERRDRMLAIAGVGYKTLFRLEYDTHFFGLWDKTSKVTDRVPGDPHRDGDGRVPVASAKLEHVETRYVRGVHGGLTNIESVYSDVFRWLNGETPKLPDDPQVALAQHLAADDGGSVAPELDGTQQASPFSDDAGLWDDAAPDPARLQQMQADLEAGKVPQFQRVRLL